MIELLSSLRLSFDETGVTGEEVVSASFDDLAGVSFVSFIVYVQIVVRHEIAPNLGAAGPLL